MAVIDLAAALKREMAFAPAARLPETGQAGSQAPSTARQAQP
jgi:hypothetical protein